MKQYFFSILIFFSMVITIKSQSISFSLKADVFYIKPETAEYSRADSINLNLYLNDSMILQKWGYSSFSSQKEFTSNPGFRLSGGIHFELSDRLSINTGLGIEYYSFVGLEKNFKSNFIEVRSDTISVDPVNSNFFHCDVYANSISDLGKIKPGIEYQLLNLLIPLEVTYSVIPGKLFFDGGLFIKTPIYTSAQSELIIVSKTMENGKEICTYVKRSQKDLTSSLFGELNLGISATLGYSIFKAIRLNLGIHTTLNDVFKKQGNLYSYYNTFDYRPINISFGLQYSFGKFTKSVN